MTTLQSPRRPPQFLASPSPSSLPPPPAAKANRSFANLARFFGVGTSKDQPVDQEAKLDSDGDDEVGVEAAETAEAEEEPWMRRVSCGRRRYVIFLPSECGAGMPTTSGGSDRPSASNRHSDLHDRCPAARGTAFAEPRSTLDNPSTDDRKGKGKATSILPSSRSPPLSPTSPTTGYSRFLSLFQSSSPPEPSSSSPPDGQPLPSPPEKRYDLVTNGWIIPKDGKRAVRDAHGMGIAGGWFVLGLGWVADGEFEREAARTVSQRDFVQNPSGDGSYVKYGAEVEGDDVVMFNSKGKGRSRRLPFPHPSNEHVTEAPHPGDSASTSTSTDDLSRSGTLASASGTSKTEESTMVKTPFTVDGSVEGSTLTTEDQERDFECLKLLYDLLLPLMHLYRNGHIQQHDPVALPPIASSELPKVLRRQGDLEKGRNVWHLGGVVANRILALDLLEPKVIPDKRYRKASQFRAGVGIMANYMRGMTTTSHLAEQYFRNVVTLGQCGLSLPDQLVSQAVQRLDIIRRTPGVGSPPFMSAPLAPAAKGKPDGFPFPHVSPEKFRPRHAKQLSTASRLSASGVSIFGRPNLRRKASNASFMSTASIRILSSPVKSTASLVQEAVQATLSPVHAESTTTGATDSLRRIHAQSAVDLPELRNTQATWWQPSSIFGRQMRPSPLLECSVEPSSVVSDSTVRQQPEPIVTNGPSMHHEKAVRAPLASFTDSLRPVASSPNFPSHLAYLEQRDRDRRASNHSAASTPRRKLPFEPSADSAIQGTDPDLAAAELRSALTKHVTCGVCGAQGVNFPECRKCGLTFCSRACRVDERKAGDGKRHVCGAWESRRLLSVPDPMLPVKRRKSSLAMAAMPLPAPRVSAC